MSDKPIIVAGLVVFLALVTFPIWYTLAASGQVPPLDRDYPEDVPRCVENKDWMVANHMILLKKWRQEIVRDGDKEPYKSDDFDTYHAKSLTGTCMQCHSRKEMCDANGDTSCVQCHNYASVAPACWDCHIELKGN